MSGAAQPQAAAARSLYRRVLGQAFERLPPAVRALHDNPGRITASGRCRVERGGHLLARLIAGCFGFPPAGEGAVRITIEAREGGEEWRRDFGSHRTTSLQGEVPGRPGLIFESFGPGNFLIDPRPGAAGLSFALKGARLFGCPLPRFLWPAIVGEATAPDGRYHFNISVALPLVGLLVRYRGSLTPEG